MNRIILFLIAISIGLSAHANYSVQTFEPLSPNQIAQNPNYYPVQPYQQYPQYQTLTPAQPAQVAQPTDFSTIQPYNQGYYPNPYQAQYSANPYQYQRPYGYGTNLPATVVNTALSGVGNTGGASSIVKNIVQSMIYAKMRGY